MRSLAHALSICALVTLGARSSESFEGRVCRVINAGRGDHLGQFVLSETGDEITVQSDLVEGFQDEASVLKESSECWANGETATQSHLDLRISSFSGHFGIPKGSCEVSALQIDEVETGKAKCLGLVIQYVDAEISPWIRKMDLGLKLEGAGCEKIRRARPSCFKEASSSTIDQLLIDRLVLIARARGILSSK